MSTNPLEALDQIGLSEGSLAEKENIPEMIADQGVNAGNNLVSEVISNQNKVRLEEEKEDEEVPSTAPWQRLIKMVRFIKNPNIGMSGAEKAVGEADLYFTNGATMRGLRVVTNGDRVRPSYRVIYPVVSNQFGQKVVAYSPNEQQKKYIVEAVVNEIITKHGLLS